ncbi:MAG: 50S ribosomal protein L15 [Patescibacteria group bacterium]
MQLHTLKPFKGSTKKAKRVGRGHGSAHGTTATRGTKGQRARSGGRNKLKLKGMKQMLLRIPKTRGFYRAADINTCEVNVRDLEKYFKTGETVNSATLKSKGLIKPTKGAAHRVKILGTGILTKSLTVEQCVLSATAQTKIEKAGGKVMVEA